MTKEDRDNHSNQLNPNNDAYWQSRGQEERPDDWQEQPEEEKKEQSKTQSKSEYR